MASAGFVKAAFIAGIPALRILSRKQNSRTAPKVFQLNNIPKDGRVIVSAKDLTNQVE